MGKGGKPGVKRKPSRESRLAGQPEWTGGLLRDKIFNNSIVQALVVVAVVVVVVVGGWYPFPLVCFWEILDIGPSSGQ